MNKSPDIGYISSIFTPKIEKQLSHSEYSEGIKTGFGKANIIQSLWNIDKKDKSYRSRKNTLPAVACPKFKNNYAKNENFMGNNWMLFDLDNVDESTLNAVKSKLVNNKSIIHLHKSCGGKGLRFYVKIPFIKNTDEYGEKYIYLQKQLEQNYNIQLDSACKDPRRLSFVAYDPEIYTNIKAEEYKFSENINSENSNTTQFAVASTNTVKTGTNFYNRIYAYIDKMALAVSGQGGHNATFAVAMFLMETCGLSITEALLFMIYYNNKLTEKWTEKELIHKLEDAAKKVNPAKLGSFNTPVDNITRTSYRPTPLNTTSKENLTANIKETHNCLTDQKIIELVNEDERGDAEILANYKKEEWLFDHTNKIWLCYDKGIWRPDRKKKSRIKAQRLLTHVYKKVSRKILDDKKRLEASLVDMVDDSEKEETIKKQIAAQNKLINTIIQKCKSLNKKQRLDNILELASSYNGAEYSEDFEKDKHLLCLKNGTFDFKNKKLVSHSPEHRLFNKVNILYDPKAICPRWEIFLSKIFESDRELIDWIAHKVGCCLTGYILDEEALFGYGNGANGKSTFFGITQYLLNDYYLTLPVEVLMSKNNGQSSTDEYQKARMFGKRCIVAPETPEGKRLSESLLKDLTGGMTDKVTARNPYGRPFEFYPTHKLWMYGNHKPLVRGCDDGIWRRIKLIPFKHQFTGKEKRDKETVMAEFRNELPGILNWAIKGYYNKPSSDPEVVLESSKLYKEESDLLASFTSEALEKSVTTQVAARNVFKAYMGWCERENEVPIVKRSQGLISLLRDRGFSTKKGHGNLTFIDGYKLSDGYSGYSD
jgi:P4 family phage/plasmid primase-like protien